MANLLEALRARVLVGDGAVAALAGEKKAKRDESMLDRLKKERIAAVAF
ncbi:MAG: hypothetical protein NTZ01_04480 [Verrucomicrobia bacterium]|nr:hypothetical protein [Verrucomicrobiota bacterium]